MKKLIVAAVVLLAVVGQVSLASAQGVPAPTAPKDQGLPWWFRKNQNMPGMPWFYRPPSVPTAAQCRVAYWYPAQFWNTDQWGNTVTWVGYAPHYVCS